MPERVLARAVEPGAIIGVVTPATPPPSRGDVDRGIEWWESQGHPVRLMPNALERWQEFAGTPAQRASDIQEAFADQEIAVVQCTRGGYGSAHVAPLLDYGAIAQTPKPFIGFSDITALHCAFRRLAGLVTFYGPGLTSVAPRPVPSLTAERLVRVLGGETTGPVPHDADGPPLRALAPGRASGPLVGGCLSDLMYTLETPWEPDLEGGVFFFEDVGESPMRIERALLQLEQSGRLAGVAAVVVGELEGCDWNGGPAWPRARTLEEILTDRLAGLGVPVLYGLQIGHGSEIATLPIGVAATVDADALTLTVDEPALA